MPLPANVKFKFAPALKTYRMLRDNLLGDRNYGHFHGELRDGIFSDEPYHTFVQRVYDMIKIPITLDDPDDVDGDYVAHTVDPTVAFKALMLNYFGKAMNVESFNDMLWRVAAGLPQFGAGLKLKPAFDTGVALGWVPVWVEDVHGSYASNKGAPMVNVHLRVLEGPYSGLMTRQRVPLKWWTRLLGSDIGFPVYNRDGPTHQNELVQCVFVAMLGEVDERFGPSMDEFDITPAMKTYNQLLRRTRRKDCPREYRHLCHRCHAGHGIGDTSVHSPPCTRATHFSPHIEMPCPRCQFMSMFDTSSKSPICVRCTDKENNKKAKVSS